MTACAICHEHDAAPDSNVCAACRETTLKAMLHRNHSNRPTSRRNDKPTLPRIPRRCPMCGRQHRKAG